MINIESRFPRVIIGAIAATSLALGTAAEEFTHKALFAPNKDYPYFESTSFPSSANEDAFDLQVAGFLAEASLLVYVEDPKFIETALDQAGFSKTRFFRPFSLSNFRFLAILFRFDETSMRDKRIWFPDTQAFLRTRRISRGMPSGRSTVL